MDIKEKKTEEKLLKNAKKLEKVTVRYLAELVKIDSSFQKLPTSITRRYNLEEAYFKNIERVMRSTVSLELLASKLEGQINFAKECAE